MNAAITAGELLGIPSIPVTASRRRGRIWSLDFAVDCPYCGLRHHHGGGDGGAPIAEGLWFAHCTSDHKAFSPECVPQPAIGGGKRCSIRHGERYELHLVEEAS